MTSMNSDTTADGHGIRTATSAAKTSVLLILSRDVVDRARAVAGTATTALRLAVSLQIVLRALIEEGLRRVDDPALLRNIERQAQDVRRIRAEARRRGAGAADQANPASAKAQRPRAAMRRSGRKSGEA